MLACSSSVAGSSVQGEQDDDSRAQLSLYRARMSYRTSPLKTLLLLIVVLCLAPGCPNADRGYAPNTQAVSPGPTSARWITIERLHLSFRLPPSFEVIEGEDFMFLARSDNPPGVLSIEPDAPGVIEHQPEAEESVTPVDIDGVDAVIVSDAVLEGGLPPGVEARELLVANGDRSFTLIMSTVEAELPSLWDELIASLTIEQD